MCWAIVNLSLIVSRWIGLARDYAEKRRARGRPVARHWTSLKPQDKFILKFIGWAMSGFVGMIFKERDDIARLHQTLLTWTPMILFGSTLLAAVWGKGDGDPPDGFEGDD